MAKHERARRNGPPEHHRSIAQHIADSWGRFPSVIEMTAKGTPTRQAIAVLEDHPRDGLTAYSTVGLSDHGGYEIASTGASRNKSFIKAIFDVASYIHDGRREAKVGAVFEKALARYYTRSEAGHLLLTDHSTPGLELSDKKLAGKRVRWLRAWPVTSDELVFIAREGVGALCSRFDAKRVDLTDLDRDAFPGVPRADPWVCSPRQRIRFSQ